jgi:plasmid stabilization system protein ParE
MYRLEISEQAEIDIKDAIDWYRMQSEFAAAYFIERLQEGLHILSTKPLIFQVVFSTFRQVVLNPFPYVVTYEVTEDTIYVYRVFHTSQNPKKKFGE